MKTYEAKFNGRKKGAIGKFYNIETTVQGENKEQASLNLYHRFEHIRSVELIEIESNEA